MLTKYIETAMKKAHYEIIEDDGTFWGEIPGFQGVWGTRETLEACRADLQSVLEEWLVLKICDGDDDIPVLGKLSLLPRKGRALASSGTASLSRDRKAS